MQIIKKVLNEYEINIVPIEMESDGCYIKKMNTIFVNSSLSEEELRKVIYHEIKHVVDHEEFIELYKIFYFRTKMEYEADYYMIESLLYEYISEYHIEPSNVNVFSFIDYYELDHSCEPVVKEAMTQYIVENTLSV